MSASTQTRRLARSDARRRAKRGDPRRARHQNAASRWSSRTRSPARVDERRRRASKRRSAPTGGRRLGRARRRPSGGPGRCLRRAGSPTARARAEPARLDLGRRRACAPSESTRSSSPKRVRWLRARTSKPRRSKCSAASCLAAAAPTVLGRSVMARDARCAARNGATRLRYRISAGRVPTDLERELLVRHRLERQPVQRRDAELLDRGAVLGRRVADVGARTPSPDSAPPSAA